MDTGRAVGNASSGLDRLPIKSVRKKREEGSACTNSLIKLVTSNKGL